jgi:hypothetical protein
MERPDQVERKISFNPEAAAFSPIVTAAQQAEESDTAIGTAERGNSPFKLLAIPRREFVIVVICSLLITNQMTRLSIP